MAGNMQDNFDENGNPIRCSFCGKEQGQVRRLVKGPTNIFICDECVAACSEILEESLASDFMDAARNGKLPGLSLIHISVRFLRPRPHHERAGARPRRQGGPEPCRHARGAVAPACR